MNRKALYGILMLSILTSCSKEKPLFTAGAERVDTYTQSSILINNISFNKTADVYATQVQREGGLSFYNSAFQVNCEGVSGALSVAVKSNSEYVSIGEYTMEQEISNSEIVFMSNGEEWSSSKGHQKGSQFKVLSVRYLPSNSGYISEMNLDVSCFLYNDKGDFIPFACITTVKF